MIPGGKIQDKYGPTASATIGAIAMGIGMIIAGTAKSYAGILWGFGVGGGIAMGVAYAAPVPASGKWLGPHQRGFFLGLTVAGYGGAAFYVAPLVKWMIINQSLSASFTVLGIAYLIVIFFCGLLLKWPEPGYEPPKPPEAWAAAQAAKGTATTVDWVAGEMAKTWQFYALILLFCLNTQAGLLIIGRDKAYIVNAAAAAVCMFALPSVIAAKNLFLAFLFCMIAYWVYGGGLALMPSYTLDFYGPKNLGFNYGLVFIGWGLGAFMPKLGGYIRDVTGHYDNAFYVAGGLLILAIIIALVTKRPHKAGA
jgi:MFS family permease